MERFDMLLLLMLAVGGCTLIGYCVGVGVVHRQAVKHNLAYFAMYKKGWAFTWREDLPGAFMDLQDDRDRTNDVLECYKRRYDACQESLAVAECALRAATQAREEKKARFAALAEQLRLCLLQLDEEELECPQD